MSRLRVGGALVALAVSCGGSTFQSGGESGGSSSSGGGTNMSGAGSSTGGQAASGGNFTTGGVVSGGAPNTGGDSTRGGASGSSGAGKSGSGGASGASAGSGGSAGGCAAGCGQARECCSDQCVNAANDPRNCGGCGIACEAAKYCADADCVAPPCETTCGSGAQCCGSACCGAGQLCCDPQGPLSRGPVCTPPNDQGTCPVGCAPFCICASPDTPIATPTGDRAIESLRLGDLVYSVDRGRLVAVPIVRTVRTPTHNHRVVRVVLSGGRVLEISPGHPTADGRAFGGLKSGDRLDGVDIASASIVAYGHDATYDILPASDSGTYFAAGVLIGSTLSPSTPHVTEVSAPACAWMTR